MDIHKLQGRGGLDEVFGTRVLGAENRGGGGRGFSNQSVVEAGLVYLFDYDGWLDG